MKRYSVTIDRVEVRQVGDSYETTRGIFSTLVGRVNSIDDALELAENAFAGIETNFGFFRKSRGLESVDYYSVEVTDEGLENGWLECVYYRETLPDSVAEAMATAQREYWDYLDYKRDSFRQPSEILAESAETC